MNMQTLYGNTMTREEVEAKGRYILKVLRSAAINGDTYQYDEELFTAAKLNYGATLTKAKYLADIDLLVQARFLHRDGDRVYLLHNWKYERTAAAAIADRLSRSGKGLIDVPEHLTVNGLELNADQREAVRIALRNPLSVITGRAGTGKTTLTQAIVSLHSETGDWVICAPTGKASRNMTTHSGLAASTIHSMLRKGPGSDFLDVDELEDASLIIVDEASMLSLPLFAGILKAAHPAARIVLIGDVRQLPSIGCGSVLSDLLHLGVPSVTLRICHRQDGAAAALSHNVHHYDECWAESALQFDNSFVLVEESDPERIEDIICEEAMKRHWRKDSVQVIAPTRAVVHTLNESIQQTVNPMQFAANGEEEDLAIMQSDGKEIRLRNADRVMLLQNDHFNGFCNGDVGIIRIDSLDTLEPEYTVFFPDGREVTWTNGRGLQVMTLAYAMTIHKSQGSEYDTVIMPITRQFGRMLTRNLLYTAISRAKKKVILVGEKEAINMALQRRLPERKSRLVERTEEILLEEKAS